MWPRSLIARSRGPAMRVPPSEAHRASATRRRPVVHRFKLVGSTRPIGAGGGFFQRATGLPWNLTFADAAEKVRAGESGHSKTAITDLGKVPAERLHPKAGYSHCRPIPAHRRAPKLSDDRPGSFTFRIYEAAVGGLWRSARSGR